MPHIPVGLAGVFSAHAEVVPEKQRNSELRLRIIRARGGSSSSEHRFGQSTSVFSAHAEVVPSPERQRR